jgi:hypothetical protein
VVSVTGGTVVSVTGGTVVAVTLDEEPVAGRVVVAADGRPAVGTVDVVPRPAMVVVEVAADRRRELGRVVLPAGSATASAPIARAIPAGPPVSGTEPVAADGDTGTCWAGRSLRWGEEGAAK